MTDFHGTVRKMHASVNEDNQAQYQLPIGDNKLDMNALIGQQVNVSHNGEIYCVHCHSKTKKSFNQGYCYRCLITLAQCDSCIVKPELCHYSEGTCREPQWGEAHCLTDHFVYIANTGNLKVGITRHVTDGVSSRWLDQGATQATVMLRVPDRLTSGEVETVCKAHIGDKTNWRTMLKGEPDKADLASAKAELMQAVENELAELSKRKGLQAFSSVDQPVHDIHYPVTAYPDKIKSINLDKTPEFRGVLTGIKGQYWMLDGDRVINIRKYAGYNLRLQV